jgi:uncharacterized SAM-binding protein YcdF (DUF218 family)
MTAGRRAVLVALALGAGAALAAPLGLEQIARFLVVTDALAPADALYVFPGGIPERAECAAQLFHQRIAPRVVVSGERVRPELEVIGMPLSDAELNARVLVSHGTPRDAVVILKEGTSTFEDAASLHRWATATTGLRRILAVTSPTHTRRARRTLARAFRDTGIAIAVQPCPPDVTTDWWRHEDSLLRVINKYIKLSYYTVVNR